jgi:hypothetical protein
MDDLAWNMFNTIKKLMDLFSGNQITPCVQPQDVNSFPDGIMDFYLPANAIVWPDLDLSHPRLFDHRGIVYASFVDVPSPHFFIEGSMDAVQHCLTRAMLLNLIHRLRLVFNRMCLRGDMVIPPYPVHYAHSAVDLNNTIKLPAQPASPPST